MEKIIKEINYINNEFWTLEVEPECRKELLSIINNYADFISSINQGVRKEIYIPDDLEDEDELNEDELFDLDLFTIFLTFIKSHLKNLKSLIKEYDIKHMLSINTLISLNMLNLSYKINEIQNLLELHSDPCEHFDYVEYCDEK